MKKISTRFLNLACCVVLLCTGCNDQNASPKTAAQKTKTEQGAAVKTIDDTVEYNRILQQLANGDTTGKWPAKAPYPLPGAIFPYHRVVAFY